MLLQLKLAGYLLIGLALVHVIFPRYFDWKKELRPLNLINRQMMEVHTFFVALTVLLMGLLCVIAPRELMSTRLGGIVCLGLAIFWGVRLVVQFTWYSPELWRGKEFETVVHVVFTILWTWLTLLFLLFWWG